MADIYSTELLRVVIAQIAQTIGYSNTQSAPLELLEDILQRFIQELARDLHSQAEHANRVEPNLKDVQLSLKNLSIDVHELLDYIGNVEPVPFVREVPEYPVKRNSNLNFLKPGSSETLTRPVHIFEYLPPILPPESSTARDANANQSESEQVTSSIELRSDLYGPKSAGDKLMEDVKTDLSDNLYKQRESPITNQLNTSSKDNVDADGHALREISSVVMTTGGFISPAIEGKLPEAFVPDIIEKLKGLDAPPKSPSPESPEMGSTLPTEGILDNSINGARVAAFESNSLIEISKAGAKNETSNLLEGTTSVTLTLPSQTKTTKKSKKKHLIGGLRNDNITDQSAAKAQEKAHRKAMRMFQKLSKTQDASVSGSGNPKKSLKNLNRNMLSALPEKSPERTQLEKLIKKQTKQRQKQLKSQKSQQRESMFKSLGPPPAPAPPMDAYPFELNQPINVVNHPIGVAPLVGSSYMFGSPAVVPTTLIENTDKFSPSSDISHSMIMSTDGIKLANEPDRNKLNIFKKLSKPKTPKAPSPSPLPIGLNIAQNLFANSSNISPLINLPSGTTITPAPALNNAKEMTPHKVANMMTSNIAMPITYENNEQSLVGAIGSQSTNLMIPSSDGHRPKKRGRKPGGKNSIKTEMTSKKIKTNKLNTNLSFESVNSQHLHPLNVATEPLNLSHVNDSLNPFSATLNFPDTELDNMKSKKVKDKKERKKAAKAKYSNQSIDRLDDNTALDLNQKYPFMDTIPNESNTTSPLKSPGVKCLPNSSPPIIGYMPGLVGALPLLPFPPRPGLIPSGLFSPTSLANFGKKGICPNRMMSHSFTDRSSTMGYRPSFIETPENKSSGLSVLPLPLAMPPAESHLERSYCNVAPLVPDSMKLTSLQMQMQLDVNVNKMKATDVEAHIGDVSGGDVMLKGKDNTYSSLLSKYLPTGSGLLSVTDLSMESSSGKAVKNRFTAGTGSLGDPIEVSDDSNDDMNNVKINKNNNKEDEHKSNIIQQFESSHPYSMINNSADSKQLKKIKINQLESNPLKSVVPSTSTNSTTTSSLSHPSPFNINFMGNDKFSLAGGADLIPLSCVDSGLAYSSKTVPVTSLAAGATSESLMQVVHAPNPVEHPFVGSVNCYDDITIIPTKSMNEMKLHKLHKKTKKPKDGKIKKKKDKKDKTRNKEKGDEKNFLKADKPKSLDKKLKKEKKKEKEKPVPPDMFQLDRSTDNIESSTQQTKDIALSSGLGPVAVTETVTGTVTGTESVTVTGTEAETFQSQDSFQGTASGALSAAGVLAQHLPSPKLELSPNQVPKLTLKLGGKSTPIALSQFDADHNTTATTTAATAIQREHSPELARFSPLVTGPPKPKQCEPQSLATVSVPVPVSVPLSIPISVPSLTQSVPSMIHGLGAGTSAALNSWMTPNPVVPPISSSTLSASSVLLPQQLLQTASQSISKMPLTQLSQQSLSLTKTDASSASVLNQSGATAELNRPSSYVDAEGYRIWICPACGKVDDGSAMIGCDGCDAWYHWICVGIFVAPKDNEDWFCRVCVSKRKGSGPEKKKKRNKKK